MPAGVQYPTKLGDAGCFVLTQENLPPPSEKQIYVDTKYGYPQNYPLLMEALSFC